MLWFDWNDIPRDGVRLKLLLLLLHYCWWHNFVGYAVLNRLVLIDTIHNTTTAPVADQVRVRALLPGIVIDRPVWRGIHSGD